MNTLTFEVQAPPPAPDPNRADVALFVGFVERRQGQALPREVKKWLDEQGWISGPYGRAAEEIEALLDVPAPIDTWEVFDHVFAWEQRTLEGSQRGATTYLGAAVRSFFAQGGRKCYVVRVGNPWPLTTPRAQRLTHLPLLIPGYGSAFAASAVDRRSWHGVAHLFGLPEVSFLCLPDLGDIVSVDPPPIMLPNLPLPEEQFVECSDAESQDTPADRALRSRAAPRCDEQGYQDWAGAIHMLAELLARHLREIQLIAAIPMPIYGSAAERDLLGFLLSDRGRGPLASQWHEQPDGVASAFVQFVYPWVRTPGSEALPEQLESPDAVLTGLLARNALTRGAFRSAALLHLADVYDVAPLLRRDQMCTPRPDDGNASAARHALLERVSLVGPTPSGLRLLSDATTSQDENYRPACINRLVSVIVRAARRLGEELTFESSGERLWTRLRERLEGLFLGLLQAGALRGSTPTEAFQVRCDRSTMSQNDIDNGRVIARIQFVAAAPIEQITVVLALDEGGQVSLASAREGAALR